MPKIFRWYINRKYQSQRLEKKGTSYIEITITRENDRFSSPLHPQDLRDVTKLSNDKLEWWQKGEENQLEGWTEEETLIIALKSKNIFSVFPELEITPKERGIEEDMVFLHFVKDEEYLEEVWKYLKEQNVFPNLDKLIVMGDVFWLDFTPQARKMAKTLYYKVLGEEQEDKDASK